MTRSFRVCRAVCVLCGVVLGAGSRARPAWAQQPVPSRAHPQGAAADTTTAFDFVDADVRTVIAAIAEAGDLQVGIGALPAKKYSLHVRRPVGRASYLALLRNVADANNLLMSTQGDLITIASAASAADATKTRLPQPAQKLYVYQLKHANATKLAGVLTAVFAGGNVRGGGSRPAQQAQQEQQGSQGNGNNGGGIFSQLFGGGGGGGGGGVISGIGGIMTADNQVISGPQDLQRLLSGGDGDNNTGEGGGGSNGGNAQASNKPPVKIVPEESTNSLLVRADPEDWAVIKGAIEAVDLRPLQVLIEVVIAEVQHTEGLNVGASATASNQRTFNGRTLGSGTLRGDTTSASAANFIASLTRYGAVDVNLALAALQSRGNVHILSRPLVLAENSLQSQLVVGSQRPFIQTSQTFQTGANNNVVQYRDVGTTLTITPTINPDGYVNLQVQQEISSATNEIQFGAPVIDNRRATATLFVKDGQTAVVGGLADSQDQETRSGIPVLSNLPLVGALFRTTAKTKSQTEFFLFLTPHIVQSDSDMVRVREEIRLRSNLLHTVPTGPLVQSTLEAPRPPVPAGPAPQSGRPVPAPQPLQVSPDAPAPVQIPTPTQP